MKGERARPLIKITNAKTVEHAGILLLKTLLTGNINPVSFVFRHPNYYKQLNEERKKHEQQAASSDPDTPQGVGPEAGLPDPEQQASSHKQQA